MLFRPVFQIEQQIGNMKSSKSIQQHLSQESFNQHWRSSKSKTNSQIENTNNYTQAIRFKGKKKNIIVGCVYKPSLSFNIDEHLTHTISLPFFPKQTKKKNLLCYLVNFNINLLNYNSNCGSSSFLDLLASCQILPFITLATRITAQSSTLIDNLFGSPSPYSSISGNLTTTISDHLPQFLLLETKPSKISNSKHQQRFYRKWSNFDSKFNSIRWNEIIEIGKNDLDKSLNSFFF